MNCKVCNKALVPCIINQHHDVKKIMPYFHCHKCRLVYWPKKESKKQETKQTELQEFDRFLLDIHAKCIASTITESKSHGYDDFLEAIKLFRLRVSDQIKEERDGPNS